ncbi:MAG: HRDC domain-containing protein [Verrucomicrobium sp.]|nr:HRDC domain-containing protein [Verrucomicrobium sp.]
MSAAVWIDTPAALEKAVSALQPTGWLALDTEADSMHHYKESVCLASVRLGKTTLLIDPIAIPWETLAPFWKVTTAVPWIIQGADFDLRLMRRIGAPEPPEVFDTMIGAQLCGLKAIGYAGLVHYFFNITLSKASQKADWSARPLTPAMLDYAAQDVFYLDGIREHLTARLKELGRLEWHKESCAKVVRTSRITKEFDPEEVWRINGSSKLEESALPILRALWHWREAEAKERDVPTFKIVNGDRLVEIAAWSDAHRKNDHLPGSLYPGGCRGARGLRFQEALRVGKAAPPIPHLPSEPRARRDTAVDRRVEKLKKGRDEIAHKLQLDPSLLAPKATLFTLAQEGKAGAERLIGESRWCSWQAELLGPVLNAA